MFSEVSVRLFTGDRVHPVLVQLGGGGSQLGGGGGGRYVLFWSWACMEGEGGTLTKSSLGEGVP